jgi:hypothetical protein
MIKEIWNDKYYKYIIFIIGFLLYLFGQQANILAVAMNDGRMPVMTNKFINTSTHFSYQYPEEVNVPESTDLFLIENIAYFSAGDVFQTIGVLIMFFTILILFIIRFFYYKFKKRKKR